VIAGLREIESQQFGYEKMAGEGVRVIAQAATKVDASARSVTLIDGTMLGYDRLVLSPGIDFNFEALPGYDEAAATKMPHAWKAGEQTLLLRKQLEAMVDGGTVVLAVPANPSRCPPAPYERASLIAYYLKTRKPRSKVLILDAKDTFSQQRLFERAWKELYGDMIERVALSQGGRVTSVDPSTNTIVTEFGNYTAQVANVIPPQKAGRIAEIAGAADHTGWCPINPMTFESKLVPNIHVIGDACLGGGIPKSASAAGAQGKACAAAIVNLLSGKAPETPVLNGVCFSTLAPDYALFQGGVYQPKGDIFVQEWTLGAFDNWDELPSKAKADEAQKWFSDITADAFG
jgi:NADPH-dependent 2,4-dienoyl-CoA reductase/sulfur reductase-like enzyme